MMTGSQRLTIGVKAEAIGLIFDVPDITAPQADRLIESLDLLTALDCRPIPVRAE